MNCCGGGIFLMYVWGFLGAVLLLGAILVARSLMHRTRGAAAGQGRSRQPRGLDALEERFARGEIDREEFEGRRRTSTPPETV